MTQLKKSHRMGLTEIFVSSNGISRNL